MGLSLLPRVRTLPFRERNPPTAPPLSCRLPFLVIHLTLSLSRAAKRRTGTARMSNLHARVPFRLGLDFSRPVSISCRRTHARRPPPLESRPPRAETSPTRGSLAGGRRTEAAPGDRASRGGSNAGSLAGVDLEEELEHVHLELRNFLNKKRARKAGAAGGPGVDGTPGKSDQVCLVVVLMKA